MTLDRSLGASLAFLIAVLVGADARAVNYTFAGKFTSNRGRIINIPMVGNTGCGGLTVMTGPNGMTIPATMTPPVHPVTRGVNTQPSVPPPMTGAAMGADLLCVRHVDGKILKTTGTMAKVGGAFTLPTMVWFDPFPSMDPILMSSPVPAVEVKYVTAIAQLATSFRLTGPVTAMALMSARAPGTMVMTPQNMASTTGGTMATAMNLAPWLKFDKLANIGLKSGRVGATGMFTWCPGAPACVNIIQAPAGTKAIVKYTGGGNAFGGTMSYLLKDGPAVSSLALEPAGTTGAAGFINLAGSGSQPTGRGYAQLLTDILASGPQFTMHKKMIVTRPVVGMQNLITMVTKNAAPFPMATNFNYGFPFTTMTVLARNTGTALGNPMVTTVTAKGYDMLTAMGGRNISLVAGGIGITNLLGLGSQAPEIASMLLTLPEPGATPQMLAGVLALLAVAGWRARKAH